MPVAVLKLPVVLLSSAKEPTAVLLAPVVRRTRVPLPAAVLPLPRSILGAFGGLGFFAWAFGKTRKQARANAITNKTRLLRLGSARLLKCLIPRVVGLS